MKFRILAVDIDTQDKGSGVKSVDMYYQKITESGKLFLFIFPFSIQFSFSLIFFFRFKEMPRKIRLLNSWTVYSEKEKAPPEHAIALYPPRTLCLDKLYNARTLTVLDNLSCVHTQWQNALAPARIPYWIGLFSHLRTVISARFLQPREAQPRRFRKWSVTYRIGLVPHFGTV